MNTLRQTGDDVAHSDTLEWLARAGFVARGAIYGIIGVLAVGVAIGAGGRTTDQQGAMQTLADGAFGSALLVVLAVGLAGYALWRLVRAAIGHGPEASDSTFDRVAGVASGIAYAILCATAVAILLGSSGGGSGSPDKATGGVLGWPAGQWLVGAAGVALIGVGLYQGYKGLSRGFLEDSKTDEMSERTQRWFTALGVFGHVSRMVVFALIGWFLLRAAITFDPDEAIGLDGALEKLAGESYGPVLLGIVAVGLVGFGAYSIADARYRRV